MPEGNKQQPEPKQTENNSQDRPDPHFKQVMSIRASRVGLITRPTELPQSLRADVILIVPPGVIIKGTAYYFLSLAMC